jgi:hypothetical protein
MAKTFEQIEKEVREIRAELKKGILETLAVKGYGYNMVAYGKLYSVQIMGDLEHTCFCPTDCVDEDEWKNLDHASVEELMECYCTALRAIPR